MIYFISPEYLSSKELINGMLTDLQKHIENIVNQIKKTDGLPPKLLTEELVRYSTIYQYITDFAQPKQVSFREKYNFFETDEERENFIEENLLEVNPYDLLTSGILDDLYLRRTIKIASLMDLLNGEYREWTIAYIDQLCIKIESILPIGKGKRGSITIPYNMLEKIFQAAIDEVYS